MAKQETIHVRVTPETKAALVELAEKEHRSLSSMIETLIFHEIKKSRQ